MCAIVFGFLCICVCMLLFFVVVVFVCITLCGCICMIFFCLFVLVISLLFKAFIDVVRDKVFLFIDLFIFLVKYIAIHLFITLFFQYQASRHDHLFQTNDYLMYFHPETKSTVPWKMQVIAPAQCTVTHDSIIVNISFGEEEKKIKNKDLPTFKSSLLFRCEIASVSTQECKSAIAHCALAMAEQMRNARVRMAGNFSDRTVTNVFFRVEYPYFRVLLLSFPSRCFLKFGERLVLCL